MKHTPATPLRVVFGETRWHLKDEEGRTLATGNDSANGEAMKAIAAHANAYPRLVEALRGAVLILHAADRGQWDECKNAEAILRELGEDA